MRNIKPKVLPDQLTQILKSPQFNYADLAVYLAIGTPIFPGQTPVFRWESDRLGFGPLDLGIVTISLQLVDEFGNLDPSGVLYKSSLSKSKSDKVGQRDYQSDLITLPLSGDLAKRVFKVGSHKLRLILEGTGTAGPFQSLDQSISVELPAIDDRWWTWGVTQMNAEWKRNYFLSGSITNWTLTSINVSVTFLETDHTDTTIPEISLATTTSPAIASGQNVAVTFNQLDLTKRWNWYTPGTWAMYLSIIHEYFYRVRLDVTDEYQNGYPSFFSQNAIVDVSPSQTKQQSIIAAFSLQSGAAYFLVAAAISALVYGIGWVGAAVEAGIASGLEAAALIAVAVANDPPVPDRRFRILVAPQPIQLRAESLKSPLGVFAMAVSSVVAQVEAMTETDSRIAGARAVRDDGWVNSQTQHFYTLRNQLHGLAQHIGHEMSAAATAIGDRTNPITLDAWDRVIHELTHNLTSRADAQKVYLDCGGSSEDFRSLLDRASQPEFGDIIASPVSVIVAAGRAAQRLAHAASSLDPTGSETAASRAQPRRRQAR